jgi:DNA-directed RNA polymerase specialized sigma24 family protein
MVKKPTKKANYVNKTDLCAALAERRAQVAAALEAGDEPPRASDYIGRAIMMIAERMARRPNFSGYSYKQDMVGDAIIDMLGAADKFDPTKSSNPFGYLSRCSWNAFIRRIHKEKRESYIKHMNFINELSYGSSTSQGAGEHESMKRHMEYSRDLVTSYERKIDENRARRAAVVQGVEKFVVDTETPVVYNSLDMSERDE